MNIYLLELTNIKDDNHKIIKVGVAGNVDKRIKSYNSPWCNITKKYHFYNEKARLIERHIRHTYKSNRCFGHEYLDIPFDTVKKELINFQNKCNKTEKCCKITMKSIINIK